VKCLRNHVSSQGNPVFASVSYIIKYNANHFLLPFKINLPFIISSCILFIVQWNVTCYCASSLPRGLLWGPLHDALWVPQWELSVSRKGWVRVSTRIYRYLWPDCSMISDKPFLFLWLFFICAVLWTVNLYSCHIEPSLCRIRVFKSPTIWHFESSF
jgi:hypothetical protein